MLEHDRRRSRTERDDTGSPDDAGPVRTTRSSRELAGPVQQLMPALAPSRRVQRSGLPPELASGIEALSGMSMDGVRVHYNSARPAEVDARAFAQGRDIHVARGAERHLAHEAWHVVQQAQGRVRPTGRLAAGPAVNDSVSLEREADVMGARALRTGRSASGRS